MAYNDSVDLERQRRAQLSVDEQKRSIEAANQNSAIARIVRIIYFIFGVLEVLLGLRVILKVLGANPDNGFANLMYAITQPFVALFATLFTDPKLGGFAVLELTTIVAMIVYAVIAWIIGRVIWLSVSRPRSRRHRVILTS